MRQKLILFVVAALFPFLGFLPAGAAAEPKLPAEKHPWLDARTAHFRITSEVSEKQTKELALGFETLRSVLLVLRPDITLQQMKMDAGDPFDIYFFRKQKSYKQFSPFERSQGFFLKGTGGYKIALNADVLEPTQTVYHEFVHYVIRRNYVSIPFWLNEGVAEYFSTMDIVGNEARIGRPLNQRIAHLMQDGPLPVRDILGLTPDIMLSEAGGQIDRFYSTAWLIVHYFLGGDNALQAQFSRFFQLLEQGIPHEEAFATAIPLTPNELDRELKKHLRMIASRYYYWIIPQNDTRIPTEFAARPLAYPELLGRLALLVQDLPDSSSWGDRLVAAALARNPRCAPALLAKGISLIKAQKGEEGAGFLVSAMEGEQDPWVLQNAAKNLLAAQGEMKTSFGAPQPPLVARARSWLERALRSNPDDTWLLDTFADLSWASEEQYQQALVALEAAHQRHPDQLTYISDIFDLYLRKMETDKAKRLVESVAAQKDPAFRAWARQTKEDHLWLFPSGSAGQAASSQPARKRTFNQALWDAILKKIPPGQAGEQTLTVLKEVDEKFWNKEYAAGLALLLTTENGATDPAIKESIQLFRTFHYTGIYKWSLETFNQAVVLGNDGHRDQALQLLEPIAKYSTVELIKTKAQALIGKWKPTLPQENSGTGGPRLQ